MLQCVQSGFVVPCKNPHHFTILIIGLNYFKRQLQTKVSVKRLLSILALQKKTELHVQLAVQRPNTVRLEAALVTSGIGRNVRLTTHLHLR